jgi:hypothetical protein
LWLPTVVAEQLSNPDKEQPTLNPMHPGTETFPCPAEFC